MTQVAHQTPTHNFMDIVKVFFCIQFYFREKLLHTGEKRCSKDDKGRTTNTQMRFGESRKRPGVLTCLEGHGFPIRT